MDERWHEIKTLWKQHQWLYILAGFLAGLLAEPFVKALADDALGFLQNLVPEAIGIVFTVLIIDSLYRRREREREERELKARLIRELGSSVNEVAKRAAEELRAHGWIKNGSLQNISLSYADLQGANLSRADLKESSFIQTNLQDGDLSYADLQNAHLGDADLQGAYVVATNLQGAKLWRTKLQGSFIDEANLQAADLQQARFDTSTRLPDANYWMPDTDLRRFTDPTHPDFWRSDNPASPAYRGKED